MERIPSKYFCYVEKTGHMHYGSPYETSSDCRNCDGAKCERCHNMYVVTDYETGKIKFMGEDINEAREHGYNR